MELEIVVNTSDTGISVFLTERPQVAVPYIVALSVVAISGTLGNVLILASIGVLLTKRHSAINSYMFIANLACSDLIVTAVINPMAVAGNVRY